MANIQFGRRTLFQSAALMVAGGVSGLGLPSVSADDAIDHTSQKPHKIASIKTFLLRHTLKKPFGVSISVPFDRTREALLVRIETDSGLVGWGETSPINGARATIDEHVGPTLIGQNPLEYRRLWRNMWGSNFGNALAVGALDMALNDVRGKALNLPIAE